MLTSKTIEAMRALVVRAQPTLELMEQNERELPTDPITHQRVVHATRDHWLEILDLAAMAARIRER